MQLNESKKGEIIEENRRGETVARKDKKSIIEENRRGEMTE